MLINSYYQMMCSLGEMIEVISRRKGRASDITGLRVVKDNGCMGHHISSVSAILSPIVAFYVLQNEPSSSK